VVVEFLDIFSRFQRVHLNETPPPFVCRKFLFIHLSGFVAAGPLYWDTNGVTAGSSNTNTNNWNGTVWSTDSTGVTATTTYVADSDVFFSAGTNATGATTVLVTGTYSANSLNFQEGSITMSASGSASLSIGAGGITMAAGLHGSPNIGGSLGTIILSSSQTWTNSTTGTGTTRGMTLGSNTSTLRGAAGQNIVLGFAGTSTGTTTMNSQLVDGAGGTLSVIKAGSGALTLVRTNTFTGGVTLEAGTLNLNAVGSLGSGPFLVKGGTIGTGTANHTLNNSVQTWDGDFAFGGSNNLNLGSGPLTVTANRTIAINGTLTGASGPVFTVGSAINGSIGLTTTNATATSKGVSGILALTGVNTYSGGTTINGGVVRFADDGAVPDTGVIRIDNNGALSVSGVHTTLAGWLEDARLSTSSTGALALTADSAENFNPSAFAGLSLGAELGKTVNYSGTITPTAGGYFVGGGGGTIVFTNANAITGSNALTLGNGGSGTVLFNESNDYTGQTTVKAGSRIRVANAGALGASTGVTVVEAGGNISLEGGVVVVGEALTINATNATTSPSNYTSGLTNLSGNNEWTGNIVAALTGGNNARFSSDGGHILVSGNVSFSGTTTAQSLVLMGSITGSGTISGVISGNTPGTPIIKNGASTWTLSGINTFTGGVRVDDGVLVVSKIGSSAEAGNLGKSDASIGFGEGTATGTLRYTGTGETSARAISLRATGTTSTGGGIIEQAGTGELAFTGAVGNAGTAVKTLGLTGSSSGTGKLSGPITGAINILKTGTGTWEISNTSTATPNTFTGTTTVTAGTLVATGGLNSTTAVNVNGGTLRLGNDQVVKDDAPISLGGGVVQIAGFTETFGALTLAAGASVLDLSGGDSLVTFGPSSALAWAGNLSITGWSGALEGGGPEVVTFTGGLTSPQIGQVTFDNPLGLAPGIYSSKLVGMELVPDALIPEPSSILLVMAASVGTAFRRRRI
jgi:fibronectin-binding autotransporter adhesin